LALTRISHKGRYIPVVTEIGCKFTRYLSGYGAYKQAGKKRFIRKTAIRLLPAGINSGQFFNINSAILQYPY
jgi:hypothetical protein